MPQPIYRYELDPSGSNPDNRVQNEPVSLASNALRVFVPQQGAYFDGSMILVDVATGKTLTKSQYYPSQPAIIPSTKYGRGIYYCVVVTDVAVSPNISASYQALGGEWAYSNSALASQIERLLVDDRFVPWANIADKPLSFNPSPHLQSSGDLYGMEYVVEALYAVRDAILLDNYNLLAGIVDRLLMIETNAGSRVDALWLETAASINALMLAIETEVLARTSAVATVRTMEIAPLTARVSALEDSVTVPNHTGTVTNHETRLVTAEGNITSQGTRLGTVETAINNHGSTLTSYGARLTATEGVNNSQGTTLNTLGTRLSAAEGAIDEHSARIANDNASIAILTTALGSHNTRLLAIESNGSGLGVGQTWDAYGAQPGWAPYIRVLNAIYSNTTQNPIFVSFYWWRADNDTALYIMCRPIGSSTWKTIAGLDLAVGSSDGLSMGGVIPPNYEYCIQDVIPGGRAYNWYELR